MSPLRPSDPSRAVAPQQQPAALNFTACVDRSDGAPLGVDIEVGQASAGWDGQTLLIRGVRDEGLVARWNAANPTAAICAGDRVVSVNGSRGGAEQLIEECKKATMLQLVMSREAPTVGDALAAPSQAVCHKRRQLAADVSASWRKDVAAAASATAVVKLVRRALERGGCDLAVAADALLAIARRSTVRTRRDWARDPSVAELVRALLGELQPEFLIEAEDVESILIALEALRRMSLQDPSEQSEILCRAVTALAQSLGWEACSVPALARLQWLAAPLRLRSALPGLRELRCRHAELSGADIVFLISAMRRCLAQVAVRGRRLQQGSLLLGDLTVTEVCKFAFDLTVNDTAQGWNALLHLAPQDKGQGNSSPGTEPTFLLAPGTTRLVLACGVPAGTLGEAELASMPLIPPGQVARVSLRIDGNHEWVLRVNGKKAPALLSSCPRLCGNSSRLQVWAGHSARMTADASVANIFFRPLHQCAELDEVLVDKMLRKLRAQATYAGVPASDLAELAEGLAELELRDEAALCVLGQEILTRKGEFQAEEFWRARVSFQLLDLPLSSVWTVVGSATKRRGGELVTTQAFAPQRGHGKRPVAEEHEVERASPPRKVGDYKQTSF